MLTTTREGRLADGAAQWLLPIAQARADLEFELVDLRDYELPFFDEGYAPAYAPVKNETAQRWQKKVAEFDGYIWITAEYNHSFPAVFKNAIDYSYAGWVRKPVGFMAYGGLGGARAVQHLKNVAGELQMAPIFQAVHVAGADFMAILHGEKQFADLDYIASRAEEMLDNLSWWTRALKQAREE